MGNAYDPSPKSLVIMPVRNATLTSAYPARSICGLRIASLAVLASLLPGCATVDAMRRVDVDFQYVSDIASELAQKRYREPAPLPETHVKDWRPTSG